MNQSIIAELGFSLRRLEFPDVAKDCLTKIDQLYFSIRGTSYVWNPELVTDLVNQFIYGVYDSRDVKRSRLSTSQKLELAEMILTYLSFPGTDTDRVAMFNTIFSNSCLYNGDIPLLILSLVSSLAIASRNVEVLKTIAVWMMQSGLDSQSVLYIARDVTKDFVSDENPDKYSTLPHVCFPFASVLLIAIGKTFQSAAPPARLIKQVTTWIRKYPNVIFFAPHSSVFEMFRWVINSGYETESELFLELLKAILIAGERVRNQMQVIPQVMTLIHEISVKIANLRSTPAISNIVIAEQWTDRLFQLIQMLISVGCLDGNEMHPIFEAVHHARLPSTRLYEMMKKMYLSS